jgi:hypothetical protein
MQNTGYCGSSPSTFQQENGYRITMKKLNICSSKSASGSLSKGAGTATIPKKAYYLGVSCQ